MTGPGDLSRPPSEALPCPRENFPPTMLYDREIDCLHWLAAGGAAEVTGPGEAPGRVVDLGCFVGGSTVALARGLAAHERPQGKLLSYDAFENPGGFDDAYAAVYEAAGAADNAGFREAFARNTRPWRENISARQGWLPEDPTLAEERRVYPEQEALRLVFCDAGKTPGVQRGLLRTFGRHLGIGGVWAEQDFTDFQHPWIPLQMHLLRDSLEPLDVLHGASMITFRCVRPLGEALEALGAGESAPWARGDAAERKALWDDIRSAWSRWLSDDSLGFLHGHELTDAVLRRDAGAATRAAMAFEAWLDSSASRHSARRDDWARVLLAYHGEWLRGPDARILRPLMEASEARRLCPPPDAYLKRRHWPTETRHVAWERALAPLQAAGVRRVGLLGAGAHTRWLLDRPDILGGLEAVCIVNERPASGFSIPVLSPKECVAGGPPVQAWLPSSDACEPELLERLGPLLSGTAPVLPVYTGGLSSPASALP